MSIIEQVRSDTRATAQVGSAAIATVIWVFTVLKMLPSEAPATVAPDAIASDINPTISPYSRALDPLSSFKSLSNISLYPRTCCLADLRVHE